MLAAGTVLPVEAQRHMRICPVCAELAEITRRAEIAAVDPAVEERIIASITEDLAPVTPVAPAWRYAATTVGLAVIAGLTGTLMLGNAGWAADSILQRAFFTAYLAAGILVSAATAAKLMTPGARFYGSPITIIMLVLIGGVVGAALYPPASYDHFARAVAACFLIGLAHATVVCSLAFFLLRRGAPVSPLWMGATVALVGGLAGMVVLYVFCPHRDLGHVLLGHASMPAAATAIGAWIGRTGRMPGGVQA
jgi:hypothetical protein